jgi:hypothetical protein
MNPAGSFYILSDIQIGQYASWQINFVNTAGMLMYLPQLRSYGKFSINQTDEIVTGFALLFPISGQPEVFLFFHNNSILH